MIKPDEIKFCIAAAGSEGVPGLLWLVIPLRSDTTAVCVCVFGACLGSASLLFDLLRPRSVVRAVVKHHLIFVTDVCHHEKGADKCQVISAAGSIQTCGRFGTLLVEAKYTSINLIIFVLINVLRCCYINNVHAEPFISWKLSKFLEMMLNLQ